MLVHGEPERDDMVRYFAGQLTGFLLPTEGWVQSYGSRCVRPPVLFGDVARPVRMTVEVDSLRSVEDVQAGEGHAHRAGHHVAVALRP